MLARKAGPRLGPDVQQAIRGSKSGDWSETDGRVVSGGVELQPGEYELDVVVEGTADDPDSASALLGNGSVVLDTAVTPELAAEGAGARPDPRRAAGPPRCRARHLRPHPARCRRAVTTSTTPSRRTASMLAAETLATVVELGAVPADRCVDAEVGDGSKVRVTVERTG